MRTFNRACVIPRAIRSVLAQTYEDFELLIVDDASTDGTTAVVQSYVESDSRVSLYTRPQNSRQQVPRFEPMNDGLKRCRGAYITHLDDDNVWHPEFLSTVVQVFKHNTATSVCYVDTCNHQSAAHTLDHINKDPRQISFRGQTCFVAPHLEQFQPLQIDEAGFLYNEYVDTNEMAIRADAMKLVGNQWIPHPSAHEINKSQGPEFSYRTHADMYLVERIVKQCGPQVCHYIPEVLCYHIVHTHPQHLDPHFDPIQDARDQGLK